jgi:hypothetical protein
VDPATAPGLPGAEAQDKTRPADKESELIPAPKVSEEGGDSEEGEIAAEKNESAITDKQKELQALKEEADDKKKEVDGDKEDLDGD